MRHETFLVFWMNGRTPFSAIDAFNEKEAVILAQAERIRAGLDYTVLRVEKKK